MSAVAHIKDYKTGKFYRDEFRGDISWNGYEHNNLLRNEGPAADGTLQFTDVAMATGSDEIRDSRGLATADFDNDGDLDIVLNNNPGDSGRAEQARATLLRNNVGERRNWLAIELTGTKSNVDAVGALVTVDYGGERSVRLVGAGSGFASQHSSRLYFGLGDKTYVDGVTVRWPNGSVERFDKDQNQPIATRQLIQITEGRGIQVLRLPARNKKTAGSNVVAERGGKRFGGFRVRPRRSVL
ncbi:MAG: CRTAC1 family protein [Pyrinomonadaceae bacterium]|nr:CRTAC1 family protein [Pyrinomonadaceae bacterium]